ncbi:MAG: hypothetical protein ACYDCC_06070 [Actinomycetota bacterium]
MKRSMCAIALLSVVAAGQLARANPGDEFDCNPILPFTTSQHLCDQPLHAGNHDLQVRWLDGTTGRLIVTVSSSAGIIASVDCTVMAGIEQSCSTSFSAGAQTFWSSSAVFGSGMQASYSTTEDSQLSADVSSVDLVCVPPVSSGCTSIAVGQFDLSGD